ncbi:YraN family protein [Dongia sp. agr-C8]
MKTPASRKTADRKTAGGRDAYQRGHGAEKRAAWWLRLKGYRVLAINWRSVAGEIDLIARRGGILAFIEVKQRIDADTATLSLAPQQRARLARAAGLFVAQRPELADLTLRFDLMAFGRMGRPVHMKDAWRPESG